MAEVILFILVMTNFAITLTLFYRYAKNQGHIDDIKKEMTDMIKQFNNNAERNIQLLEDRITNAKSIIQQIDNPPLHKPKGIQTQQVQVKDEKIQVAKELLAKIKNKRIEALAPEKPATTTNKKNFNEEVHKYIPPQLDRPTSPTPKNNNENYSSPIVKKTPPSSTPSFTQTKPQSFIQKAYTASPTKAIDMTTDLPELKELNSIEKTKNFETELSNDESKKTIHQIAKLIGEGKSLEEISSILGISLGEIKLFTSLVKKKLFHQ